MPPRLRIFVSSPGDVPDERLRADLIVDKLSQDYSRFFTIESYRWEHEPMLASKHFQDAIELPSAFDIVVLILWSRLGTPLPERTEEREYRGIDGRAPVTGTEWEYEEALRTARERGAPDLLAFRNINPAPLDTRNSVAREESLKQLDALDAFWKRHFADRGVFLAAYDEYRTIEEFAQRFEESLRKLIQRRIAERQGGQTQAAIWLDDPFRGLESYEFEHAAIFFGRDGLVAKAAEQLATGARAGTAFLLISGPSGSGKSSLVKAALVPRLTKPQRIQGAGFLRWAVFRPAEGGGDVILGLVETLTRQGPAAVGLPEMLGPGQDAARLAAHLRAAIDEPGFVFAGALGHLTQAARLDGRLLAFEEAKLILVIDQLEELFTTSAISVADRQLFLRLIGNLARSGAVWVIATLRADFWHRAAEIPELVALTQGNGRLDVSPPSPAELADMIRKPAQAAGLGFEVHGETGLALDGVLAEHAANEPGVLPLLSFTLDALYAKDTLKDGSRLLTFATYQSLGGLEGAIATRADQIVASLSDAAQAAVPRVLRALATISSTADQTTVARAAPLANFPEGSAGRQVVDGLTAGRLLVASEENGTATVRLAHEALVSHWQRAREQLAADGRDLQTRALVERQQARWQAAVGRAKQQLLLRDPDLANAVDLSRRWGDEVDAVTRQFIQKSRRRASVRQRLGMAAAAGFAAIAAIAVWKWNEASAQRDQASVARKEAILQKDQASAAREQVVGAYANLLDTLDELAATIPNNVKLLRSIADSSDKTGAALEANKRNYDALVYYSYSPSIRLKLGDALMAQGHREEAVAAYQQSIDVAQTVAKVAQGVIDNGSSSNASPRAAEPPDNQLPQTALADSQTVIGDALQRQGKLDDALAAYSRSADMAQKFSKGDERNSLWLAILVTSNAKIGDILLQEGKHDAAAAEYRKSLGSLIELATINKGFEIDCGAFRENASGSWTATRSTEIRYTTSASVAEVVSVAGNGTSVSTVCSSAGCQSTFGAYQGQILRRGTGRSNDVDMASAIDQTCSPAPRAWNLCDEAGAPDVRIDSCTKVIESAADHVIDVDPKYARAFDDRGFVFWQKKDLDRAIADYDEAIKLDPSVARPFNNRGVVHWDRHEHDRAIADYDKAIELDPTYFNALFNRGVAYAAKRDYNHAISDYDAAIKLNPHVAQVFNYRGLVFFNKQDYDNAIVDFSRAVEIDQKYATAYGNRCFARAVVDQIDAALADCNLALKLAPDHAAFFSQRGFVYLKFGQMDNAIADYDQALRRDPNLAESLYGRGLAKQKKGDREGGNADISGAKARDPDIVQEFARLGVS